MAAVRRRGDRALHVAGVRQMSRLREPQHDHLGDVTLPDERPVSRSDALQRQHVQVREASRKATSTRSGT